jgi:hypothetical protein
MSIPSQIDIIELKVREVVSVINIQIDIVEVKMKEILNLIDILKRAACVQELPEVLADDLELKMTIKTNEKVSENHGQTLVDIENYKFVNLHHIKH